MRKLMLLLTFLVCAAPAWAQRVLPADAKRAQVGEPLALPMIQLGSETRRLAPGGIIIDSNNRSVTHGQLPPGSEVLYRLNGSGEISRIIILTPQEQVRLDSAK